MGLKGHRRFAKPANDWFDMTPVLVRRGLKYAQITYSYSAQSYSAGLVVKQSYFVKLSEERQNNQLFMFKCFCG